MTRSWLNIPGLIAGLFLAGTPAYAQQTFTENALEAILTKLADIEQRLSKLEQQASPASSAATVAPTPDAVPEDIDSRLEALDQQIRIAARRRELEQEDAEARAATAPVIASGIDGFGVQSNNGDYRLTLGMAAQMDGRFSLDDPRPITDTFTLRKIRPTFTGRVAKYFDFKVMPDFGGTTIIQDAYFDVRFSPKFRIRLGKDKTPIGYEQLIGDNFLLFPERSLANSLVPNRDIGVQAQGDLGPKVFYAAGVFNGIPDKSSTSSELDTNDGKDLAGRIVVQPFRSAATPATVLNGFGFQVGGSTGHQAGTLPVFKTSVNETYFSYNSGATASGERRRMSPALFYYYKSFGAFGEYMRSTQSVARAGVLTEVNNQAWDVSGSIVLTGEAASERGVRPRRNFDPAQRRWGALQLIGRYSILTVDRDVFAAGLAAANANRQARSFTVGANWYPASFIKYYANFERTTFNGNVSRPPENVIFFRTQLAF